ncbi:MAG: Txe/YoeB family addiction module toxin [Lachnospiraceae bacterium]|nr:Txe/YoeB family addiction module toxin [Lachnospiraceae bacterium]
MYRIVYEKRALKDLENLKRAGISAKAKVLVELLRQNPYQNPPQYEKLVGKLDGIYSRRINVQHRLEYQVYQEQIEAGGIQYDGTVKIIRMWTPYAGR